MYEYLFNKMERNRWGSEPFPADYQQLVLEYAQQGWRFVQMFAPANRNRFAEYAEMIMVRNTAESGEAEEEKEFGTIRIGKDQFGTDFEADYHEIIQEYGENGWLLKQIFAPAVDTQGAAYYDLFFVKMG